MEAMKCQLNDIVSAPNAEAATADTSNMHLGSDLPESECICLRSDLIPQAIKDHCGLEQLTAQDNCVHARVAKAWHGLKQAGKIAHDNLVQRLEEHGHKKNGCRGLILP